MVPAELKEELDAFVADLFREDEIGSVIRAHIRIELLLNELVEHLVPIPEYIKKLNLDYDGTLTLGLAMGLNPQFGPPLRSMGKLRNAFAHRLDKVLESNDVNNLYSAMSQPLKEQVQSSFTRIRSSNESIHQFKRFSDVPSRDQFKLMAITLWAAFRVEVIRMKENGAADA